MNHFIKVHRVNGDIDILNTRFITRVAYWEDRRQGHTRVFLQEDACAIASIDVYESLEEIENMLINK